MPALEFIGIAEDTGLIGPIGSWVLAAACADLAEWPEPVYLSVNLSASQVSDGLVDEVEQLLEQHVLRGDRLVLEITGQLMLPLVPPPSLPASAPSACMSPSATSARATRRSHCWRTSPSTSSSSTAR